MKGLLVFVGIIVGIYFLLRYMRQKEIEKFMDSDMADFQTFQLTQKKTEAKKEDEGLKAKAEAFAALNPGLVTKSSANDSAQGPEILNPANMPDPRLYERKDEAFDEVTRHMISLLNQVLPRDTGVLWQVTLSEFAKIDDDQAANYKLGTHSVPYLIYRAEDMSILCGIRHLDRGNQGQTGGDFIKGVFTDIGIPLLSFPVGTDISELELRDQLDPIILAREEKLCPKCGEIMQLRKAVKGKNQGKIYWVCSEFPGCRGVVQI